ncbi:LysR family transcriptional regulator [Pedomonas sp. V897]|uniref:LysR family transcriptional regulator n=1 Tax=Pedomonas sp. V897 TaxID=3446482 RepID=UPI003EE03217
MDWEKLRLFHIVAEAGSFTEAAKRLHQSQPALSRQIQALEATLGAALFHRHARGLALTHEGEQLLEAARLVAERIDSVERSIQATRTRPSGELRVTTTVSFGSTWLIKHMRDFLETYPDIRINLLLSDDDIDLSTRQADVALRFHEPKQSDLIQKHLADTRYFICASPAYLEKYGTPQTVEELDHHRLVVYGSFAPEPIRDVNWILSVGRSAGRRTPILSVNNIYALTQAIEDGIGIGTLPAYLLHASDRLVPVLPELVGPRFPIYFVYPRELKRSIRVAVLRDFLASRATQESLGG